MGGGGGSPKRFRKGMSLFRNKKPMSFWIAGILCASLFAIGWLAATEFSYFGREVVSRLYDWCSVSYEKKWNHEAYSETRTGQTFLAHLRPALDGKDNARVLDLACGTGRASLLLLEQAWFPASDRHAEVDSEPDRLFVNRTHLGRPNRKAGAFVFISFGHRSLGLKVPRA